MTPTRLLHVVAGALAQADIPFMVTGSMAASWHGAGRATMDIDLVIDPTSEQLESLLTSLDRPGLYVPSETARAAFHDGTMFNVVDIDTGWKADLIFRKRREFSKAEFARRIPAQLDGVGLWVTSVEDLILAKLEWAKLGGSARQLDDVAALLDAAGTSLDTHHVEQWVPQLGLDAVWQAARRQQG